MEGLLIILGIYIVGVFIAIIEIAYINAKEDEHSIDVVFSLLSWLIPIVALGYTITHRLYYYFYKKFKKKENE